MQKIRKNNERSLRYLKTDQRTHGLTDGQTRAITKDPLGKPRSKMKETLVIKSVLVNDIGSWEVVAK